MRSVVQRVTRARVVAQGVAVAEIGAGLLILVGVGPEDGEEDSAALAAKLVGLRVFPDEVGKMNLSVNETGGSIVVVSQFTLLADLSGGRRPSFIGAAPPDHAEPLVEFLAEQVRSLGVRCETGRFGAHMEVELVNDGPVTFILETAGGKIA